MPSPYYPRQSAWLDAAGAAKPVLRRQVLTPARAVAIRPDPAAFQGYAAVPAGPAWEPVHVLARGGELVADFGRPLAGTVSFRLDPHTIPNDAPIRLFLTFAEVPFELAEGAPRAPIGISDAWHQEHTAFVDELPAVVEVPRRMMFRYLRIHWRDVKPKWRIRLSGLSALEVSAAPFADPAMPEGLDAADRAIVAASVATLRHCMQSVFEDGPKRDRRLWLGDLRLQMMTNAVTFRDFALARRCLLLLAGLADGDGLVPACVFDYAAPASDNQFLVDYAALFGPTLLDYLCDSGDVAAARELLPVAVRQVDWLADALGGDARFKLDRRIFIDWKAGLERDAALAGVAVYSLRRTAELARKLGVAATAARLDRRAAELAEASRAVYRDPGSGLPLSGKSRQASHAGWAWWTLGGILTASEARASFDRLEKHPKALEPGGPYLMHHVIDALITCGRPEDARKRLRAYWGSMLDAGLSVFPEVWDPSDSRHSPYGAGGAALNSYCHAWSCTPPWLLHRIAQTEKTRREATGKPPFPGVSDAAAGIRTLWAPLADAAEPGI